MNREIEIWVVDARKINYEYDPLLQTDDFKTARTYPSNGEIQDEGGLRELLRQTLTEVLFADDTTLFCLNKDAEFFK